MLRLYFQTIYKTIFGKRLFDNNFLQAIYDYMKFLINKVFLNKKFDVDLKSFN